MAGRLLTALTACRQLRFFVAQWSLSVFKSLPSRFEPVLGSRFARFGAWRGSK